MILIPIITFDGPPNMTKEQKAQVVKEFTEAASRAVGLPKESFIVIIREIEHDNVGVGGELLSEKKKSK